MMNKFEKAPHIISGGNKFLSVSYLTDDVRSFNDWATYLQGAGLVVITHADLRVFASGKDRAAWNFTKGGATLLSTSSVMGRKKLVDRLYSTSPTMRDATLSEKWISEIGSLGRFSDKPSGHTFHIMVMDNEELRRAFV